MAYGFYGLIGLSSRLSEAHGALGSAAWLVQEISGDFSTTLEMTTGGGALEMTVVYIILIGAVGYAAWWVYERIRKSDDPCEGCTGCQLKELKDRAKECEKRKKSCSCTKK